MTLTRNELKDIKTLLTKKGRRIKKMFLSEGVRLLEEAVRHRFLPEKVIFSKSVLSERGGELLDSFEKFGVNSVSVSARDIEYISGTDSSQGIVALFKMPSLDFSEQMRLDYRRIIWCYGINDPGNLGTLVRSALAFNFDLLIAGGNSVEFFAPKVVRSSAGSIFGMPVCMADTDEILDFLNRKNISLIGTDLDADKAPEQIREIVLKKRFVLAIGSEAEGLPEKVTTRADILIKVEHSNRVESLNAAVAGSILMCMINKLTG